MLSRTQRSGLISLVLMLAVCIPSFGLHAYVPSRHPARRLARHASLRHAGVRGKAAGQTGRRARLRAHLRHVLWNPVFRPSHESLLRQNEEIDRMELPRIQDDAELEQLKASGDLVSIDPSEHLRIDPRLDPDRRFCRPWTRDFVEDLGQAYYSRFHDQIQVNSAVRTVIVQKKLRRRNRNAAPEYGDTASSHLAGITVDIQRRGMTKEQIRWVEQYMMPLRDMGLLEPEEERHQWVFHVAVSGRYADFREGQFHPGQPQQAAGNLTLQP